MSIWNNPFRTLLPGLALLLAAVLSACSGEGTGGGRLDDGGERRAGDDNRPEDTLQPTPQEQNGEGEGDGEITLPGEDALPGNQYTPRTLIVDNSDGGTALQQALDTVRAGDTVIIRAGAQRYQSAYRFPGETLRGFTLSTSGSADAPIRIVGEAAGGFSRPIIDQGKIATHDPDAPGAQPEPTVGLYLLCASHVVIDNLEIRNVHGAGISTSLGACESRGIRIENSLIHRVYGDRQVGGIRLSRASDVTIYNNHLRDIYQTDSHRELPLIPGDNQQVQRIRIEHNHFEGMQTGVRLQGHGDKSIADVTISRNHFDNLDTAIAAALNAAGAATAPSGRLTAIAIDHNLFAHGQRGVVVDAGAGASASGPFTLRNNTFYALAEAPIRLSGAGTVSIYNSIFSHINRDLLVVNAPVNPALETAIDEYDYNLYWHTQYNANTGPEWLLGVGGVRQQSFPSFTAWQQAYSDSDNLPAQLRAAPDQASRFIDPAFNDVSAGDFTPSSPFALSGGRHGGPLGAFNSHQRPGVK